MYLLRVVLEQSNGEPYYFYHSFYLLVSGRRQTMSNRPDVVYNITYNGNGDNVVEFGSREGNVQVFLHNMAIHNKILG